MTTSKLLIALGLTLALGTLSSCKSKDTPIPTPKPAPTPTPTPTPTPELPAKGIKIENGVLITYGADVTPADGIVRLDKDKVHTIGEKAFAGTPASRRSMLQVSRRSRLEPSRAAPR